VIIPWGRGFVWGSTWVGSWVGLGRAGIVSERLRGGDYVPYGVRGGRQFLSRMSPCSLYRSRKAMCLCVTVVCITSPQVFTPLEYACCGLSEEEALKTLGEDDVEVS
jgi:hypothetical protein